jgi:signal transduction histidine kinase
MFKKLHFQLTLISTLITGFIVVVMTCLCLTISEHSLYQSQYLDFVNRITAIQVYLQTQTSLSTQWLAQTENNGQMILYIEDNGNPIAYQNQKPDSTRGKLIQRAKITAQKAYQLNISDLTTSKVVLKHVEFTIRFENSDYFASAAYIPKGNGSLGVIAVYTLQGFRRSVLIQRLIYIGLDLLAIIALGLFSFFFTKHFIKPVERSRKHQTEFIASASHELRSPLAVISSSLSAMKKADKAQTIRFEEIIDTAVKRMTRLVGDMLSLANADNHSWKMQMENTDVLTLLLNIYEAYEPVAREKGLQLTVSPPDEPFGCVCDRQRMEQVLSILLDNAISYTKSGGKVGLSALQTERGTEITVADNGIGISDENKKRIFDRFYRADSAHESKDHFGLGLCIAYEIIKLHKGELTVKDTPGGGTIFRIMMSHNPSSLFLSRSAQYRTP